MDNRLIGVFDSGLGGLTAVKEIMNLLPLEGIVYFGDTGRVPYGTRSKDTIIKYVHNDIRFLLTFDIKCIVVACGTASAAALEAVKNDYELPIIGVVEPAAKKAASITKNGRIAVLGTSGTINSGVYEKEIKKYNQDAAVFSKACPLFVPLVENGHLKTEAARLIAKEYLLDIKNNNVDTIILGCTHYPLLTEVINDIMEGKTRLVDSGKEAALHLNSLLKEGDMLTGEKQTYRYYVSDAPETFSKIGSMFLKNEINGQVQRIEIEKF